MHYKIIGIMSFSTLSLQVISIAIKLELDRFSTFSLFHKY